MEEAEPRMTDEEWAAAMEDLKFIAEVGSSNSDSLTLGELLEHIEEFLGKTKRCVLDGLELSFTPQELITYTCTCKVTLCPEFYQLIGKVFLGKFAYALLDSVADIVLPPLLNKEGEEMLETLLDVWDKYMKMSSHLVEYFKKLYNEPIPKIIELDDGPALHVICHAVFDQFWPQVQDTMISMMKQERHEDIVINHNLLKRVIEFTREIQNKEIRQYYDTLEEGIIAETSEFFSKLSSDWLARCTFGGYLKEVEFWLAKEKTKRETYLNEDLMAKVLKSARDEIIDKPATEIAWLIPAIGLGLVMLVPKADENLLRSV